MPQRQQTLCMSSSAMEVMEPQELSRQRTGRKDPTRATCVGQGHRPKELPYILGGLYVSRQSGLDATNPLAPWCNVNPLKLGVI